MWCNQWNIEFHICLFSLGYNEHFSTSKYFTFVVTYAILLHCSIMIFLTNPLQLGICALFISSVTTKAEFHEHFAHLPSCGFFYRKNFKKYNLWSEYICILKTHCQFPSRKVVSIHTPTSSSWVPVPHRPSLTTCWFPGNTDPTPSNSKYFISIWISLVISELD